MCSALPATPNTSSPTCDNSNTDKPNPRALILLGDPPVVIRTKKSKQQQNHQHQQHKHRRAASISRHFILVIIATVAVITAASKTSTVFVCALRHHASAFVVAATSSSTSSKSVTAATRSRLHGHPFARGLASFGIQKQQQQPFSSSQSRIASTRASTTTTMNSSSSTSSSSNESTETFEISKNLRGLFAGSGVEGLSNPLINQQIVDLLPAEKKKSMNDVKVVYLGTATYDIAFFKDKQTGRFVDRGCQVSSLDIASKGVELDDAALETIASADVLLVGGGNTLYAVDRWRHLGLVPHLKKAMENGCILTGGSAGAICWFDSGHSDSADPETYRQPMLKKYGNNESEKPKDESSEYDPANKKEWKYLRVQGLGFVPGPMVCCPHHDKTQSNGLLRAYDFDKMLLERAKSSSKSVLGIGIDHYAAFVVEGENYRVYVLPDKAGSVSSSRRESDAYDEEETSFFDVGEDGTANGTPGVWIKRVVVASSSNNNNDNGDNSLVVEAMVCPPEGKLVDLLAYGGNNLPGQNNEEHDENQTAVETCRRENPSGIQG